MIQKLQYLLKEYDAYVLAYPSIDNTPLDRDTFVSDTGVVFYSVLKTDISDISFSIDFKGDDQKIKENRRAVSKLLENTIITFDEETYFKGRFIVKEVTKRYFYETVTFKGNAIACLYTQSFEIKRNQVNKIYNLGDLKTPVRIKLIGTGTDIKITGFESTIDIKDLKDELIIDAEKGISDERGINNVSLFSFPYILNNLDIRLYGTGSFKCFIEFEGRVIC